MALKEKTCTFSLASKKLLLSVSNALARFTFIVPNLLPLPKTFIVTIKTLECILVCSVTFLFHIPPTRAIALGALGAFNPPQIFKTNKILERYIKNALSCIVLGP